jgi:hypothetical protein
MIVEDITPKNLNFPSHFRRSSRIDEGRWEFGARFICNNSTGRTQQVTRLMFLPIFVIGRLNDFRLVPRAMLKAPAIHLRVNRLRCASVGRRCW